MRCNVTDANNGQGEWEKNEYRTGFLNQARVQGEKEKTKKLSLSYAFVAIIFRRGLPKTKK